jgi:putative transposase
MNERFSWQTGFAAFSVSDAQVERVFQYIRNQKQHHRQQSFQMEFEEYIRLFHESAII